MGIAAGLLIAQLGTALGAIDSAVTSGIQRGVYPGAVVVVGRRDTAIARAYGHHTWSRSSPVVSVESTLFDLASLTKVVATTTAVMLLVEEERIDLDAPVARYLPRFTGPDKSRVTVRHLLTHTSGLPSYRPYYKTATDRETMLALVYAESLIRRPGRRMEYSDLNAILLGELVGGVGGEPLDRHVTRRVFEPLGMGRTRFGLPRAMRGEAAPTGVWRGTAVGGEVHDQNAARMGGVSGHAGLFSTGADLARFAQMILRDGAPLLEAATLDVFFERQPRAGNRALGWETAPTDESTSSAGVRLTPGAVGHSGFTGTSIWVDRERDLFVILLTNRAFNPRIRNSFTALKEVRGAVADAATMWVDGQLCAAGRHPPTGVCE